MKRRFWIAAVLIAALGCTNAIAQQQVMFTQYMFNALAINPAYAGSHEALSITALARKQWVGLEGAPSTQTLSLHSPINKKSVSLGMVFMHDQIGLVNQNSLYLDYAYRIKIASGHLSMGLQFGFNDFRINYSSADTNTANDPSFSVDDISAMKFNGGAGFYYNSDRFYVGVSSPLLFKSSVANEAGSGGTELLRHYFVMVGHVFDLNPYIKLKPHALVKMVEGAPVAFDLNASVLFDEVVWLGVSWRSFDSIDLLAELQINDQLRVGYAYDFSTSDIAQVSSGSHEIMLNYRFAFSKKRLVTPRYF